MTKEIELTRGLVALVDDEWFDVLNEFSWCAAKNGQTFYATHGYLVLEPRRMIKQIQMHRLIVGDPPGILVDHWDGNGLNNQRSNLRLANKAQNGANRGLPRNNTSGFKGVHWHKNNGNWRAIIGVNNQRVILGHFCNREDAARAYDEAAVSYFGEFALTNRKLGLLSNHF